MMVMDVSGRRKKGRPKGTWMDSIKIDLTEKEILGEETPDQADLTGQKHQPQIRLGRYAEETCARSRM